VEDNVEFRVNLGYPELLQELADGLIGEHSTQKYFLIHKRFSSLQCCKSGIRCLFDPWIRDPEWVKIRIWIRDQQPGSFFQE
jgi:hypothetical protein